MAWELNYFCGVSWPRSGHHLLVRILSAYFGDRFGYCEHYSSIDCCKVVPCARAGVVNLSKNHDYDSTVPIVSGGNYLIQYREFCPSLVSNYELDVRNKGKDSRRRFRKFAERELEKYETFLRRWAVAEASNCLFVRLDYERLTSSPAEILETVIKLFAPNEPLDRERLALSIESAERISVQDGAEIPEAELGVRASRDIKSFRHYDESLFVNLDERSRSAYAAIANMPMVQRTSDLGSSSDTFDRPSITARDDNQNLYVDATGMLALAGVALTGIPRVQDFLTKQAIDDPDPTVQVILFDSDLGSYRIPTDRELWLLDLARPERENPSVPPRGSFSEARRRIRENPYLGREFDRYFSTKMTGEQAGDLKFLFAKTMIRGYRYYQWALGLNRRRDATGSKKIDPDSGIVLMSHMTAFSSLFTASMSATKRRAFISHDLIPWLHPEFVGDERQATRFVLHLKRLLQSGAHALCTSDTSLGMLRQFVEEFEITGVRTDRFPLPSTLYEVALAFGLTSRLMVEEPFILYCSTVEIRKNHLLLARIWKRAREEGVALPKLVCAGKWGWGVDYLRAFLSANPDLSQCIEFVGPISDRELIDLYRSAAFGVVPSQIEGWGFGASECLDFGTPVIVSTAPALQEAVRGLMPTIDPNDEDAWYQKIRQLADGTQARERLRRKIADQYRPVTARESWQAIKTALRASV